MAFPDFEPVDRRSRLLIQPIKKISTDFAIQNVVADYHDRDPLLGVVEIPNELPYNDYFEYFGPDFKLHIAPSNMANQNTGEYVDKIRSR